MPASSTIATPSPAAGLMPVLRNRASRKRREAVGRNAAEAHDRAGLVERPAAAEHPLHQRRLRTGEHVADLALVLHRGAQRVLDAAAVERADRLELVERDRQLPAAALGDAPGQREHLLREARDVALGPDGRERRATAPSVPPRLVSMRTSGRTAASISRSHEAARPVWRSTDTSARA